MGSFPCRIYCLIFPLLYWSHCPMLLHFSFFFVKKVYILDNIVLQFWVLIPILLQSLFLLFHIYLFIDLAGLFLQNLFLMWSLLSYFSMAQLWTCAQLLLDNNMIPKSLDEAACLCWYHIWLLVFTNDKWFLHNCW